MEMQTESWFFGGKGRERWESLKIILSAASSCRFFYRRLVARAHAKLGGGCREPASGHFKFKAVTSPRTQ